MFGELLEEVIDGGHRVLVFSQFVKMLTLLKEKLAQENIEYCYPRRLNHQSRCGWWNNSRRTAPSPSFSSASKPAAWD